MISETLPLSEHELIGATECAAIAHRVLGLRSHWTRRSSGEFYSLGAASYLDATRGPEPYLAAARVTNKLLLDHFGGLYDRIVAFFRELLDEEVSLDVERAAPGFHVFVLRGEDRSGDNPARRAHFDHQWRLAYPGARPEGTLSFTLAIATPSGGAGMALWPLRGDQPGRSSRDAWSRTLEQTPQLVPLRARTNGAARRTNAACDRRRAGRPSDWTPDYLAGSWSPVWRTVAAVLVASFSAQEQSVEEHCP